MNVFKKTKPTLLDEVITKTEWQMHDLLDKKDYEKADKVANTLETLYASKEKATKSSKISKDTMAVIAGNLIGIGLILSHERLHVISTKALGFVLRGRP